MIFREISNAAFCFSLRRPGAEIMGGGVQTPSPSRRWKIQRPSRARVKTFAVRHHTSIADFVVPFSDSMNKIKVCENIENWITKVEEGWVFCWCQQPPQSSVTLEALFKHRSLVLSFIKEACDVTEFVFVDFLWWRWMWWSRCAKWKKKDICARQRSLE